MDESATATQTFGLRDILLIGALFGCAGGRAPPPGWRFPGASRFSPTGTCSSPNGHAGTGDGTSPHRAQELDSLAGKILRVQLEGGVPATTPGRASSPSSDHGPSGELGRHGHDEVSLARAGQNLGWPTIYGCGRTADGLAAHLLEDARDAGRGRCLYRHGDPRRDKDKILRITR